MNRLKQFKTKLGLGSSEEAPKLNWNTLDIQLFGLPKTAMNYQFFQEKALCGGKFKTTINDSAQDATEVVKLVGQAVNNLGVAKLGLTIPNVKSLPLKNETGPWWSSTWSDSTTDNALAGDYPLTRFMWLYINNPPLQPLPLVIKKLVRLIMSEQGQKLAEQQDFTPLSSDFMATELENLK